MNAIEFAYWLQGRFELDSRDLTRDEMAVVAKRAAAVKMPQQASAAESRAVAFVGLAKGLAGTPGIASEVVCVTLRKELNDLFIHAIDQSYKGDQQKFNDLHGGDKDEGPVLRPRC